MSSNLVNIMTFETSQAAYFLQSHLDSSGIESFISFIGADTSRIMQKSEGVKIKVRDIDVEKAIGVILDLSDNYGNLEDQQVKHFRKILVPVDFTDVAATASQFAIGLAENLHGEIRLFHAYDDPLLKGRRIKKTSTFEKYQVEGLKSVEEDSKDNMIGFTKKLKEKVESDRITKARIHYSMVLGLLESEIIQMADLYRPEVIVLGVCRGVEKANHLTETLCLKIAQNSKIPLLVVPEEAKFTGVDKINVLYATDFLDSDFTSMRTLLALMTPFNAKFFCIHVENEDDNSVKIQKMNELQEVIRKDYSNYTIDLQLIKNEDMINGIMDFVNENNIQIISFTNPKRSMIYRLLSSSNLKRMIQQSNVPMFIFHS